MSRNSSQALQFILTDFEISLFKSTDTQMTITRFLQSTGPQHIGVLIVMCMCRQTRTIGQNQSYILKHCEVRHWIWSSVVFFLKSVISLSRIHFNLVQNTSRKIQLKVCLSDLFFPTEVPESIAWKEIILNVKTSLQTNTRWKRRPQLHPQPLSNPPRR